jgi:hypothetical protein
MLNMPHAHHRFRVPLNLIVITLLASVSSVTSQTMLGICGLLSLLALALTKTLSNSIAAATEPESKLTLNILQ